MQRQILTAAELSLGLVESERDFRGGRRVGIGHSRVADHQILDLRHPDRAALRVALGPVHLAVLRAREMELRPLDRDLGNLDPAAQQR